jgi:hypothetical protein
MSLALLILKLQSWQTAESYELTVCKRQNGLTHTGALSLVPVRNITICCKTALRGQRLAAVVTQITKITSYVAGCNI